MRIDFDEFPLMVGVGVAVLAAWYLVPWAAAVAVVGAAIIAKRAYDESARKDRFTDMAALFVLSLVFFGVCGGIGYGWSYFHLTEWITPIYSDIVDRVRSLF